jgi:hypothetical protein
VENYSIVERSQEELRYLARIKALRKIELFAQKVGSDLSSETMKKDNIHELVILFLGKKKQIFLPLCKFFDFCNY